MNVLKELRNVAFRTPRADWSLTECACEDEKAKDEDDDGPSIPVETQIWSQMSGKERAEVMDAVGTKGMKQTAALRACAAYIKKNLTKYKSVLKRSEQADDHDYDESTQTVRSVVSEMRKLLGEDEVTEAVFKCQECGAKYNKPKDECSKCGGSDIDIDVPSKKKPAAKKEATEVSEELNSVISREVMKQMKKLGSGTEIQTSGMAKKTGRKENDLLWVMDKLAKEGKLAKGADGYYSLAGDVKENVDVANTIAAQMGGAGRIKMMLGGKVMAIDNGLAIKWPNKETTKGNYVEVTLRGDDTYDMEFFAVKGAGKKSVKKYEMIYADQLKSLFRDQTGWALSL